MTNDQFAIFAFFNHPAMLGWLAATAAPLLIHLLSRRRYREMPWAAMQYLLAAVRKSARRVRIEQWLLLTVRTAIIVTAVVALAEPALEHAGLSFVSGQRTHKLFVLDASYSMGYRAADRSLFERAKELAGRIVDESSQGDGFTLVLLASPPRVVVGNPAFEWAEFKDELDHLRLLDGGADLPATLAKVEEVLDAARRDNTRLTHHEIYFLTDLGKNTWLPNLRGADAAAEFRQRSERLAAQASIVVADLGQDAAENLAVESLSVAEPYATVGRELKFEAVVRNYGRQPRTRQLVELYVDGRRAGEDHVDLPAGGAAQAALTYRFDTPGEHQLEIRVAGDLLDVDNHRWRAVPVAGRLRVLCVNGKPSGGTYQGATDYLVVALAPHG
ncbi:MAG TPA: BatA domain-containing protein, partial [Pirellulales bacterium]|nr:BatA domain-containing protein [Pirellulales bacterium]